MKQLVVPNSCAMCAVLHSTILAVKKPATKGIVLGMVQVLYLVDSCCLPILHLHRMRKGSCACAPKASSWMRPEARR